MEFEKLQIKAWNYFSNKMNWLVQRNRRKEINGRKWKNGIQWIKVDGVWKATTKSIKFHWSIFGQSPKIEKLMWREKKKSRFRASLRELEITIRYILLHTYILLNTLLCKKIFWYKYKFYVLRISGHRYKVFKEFRYQKIIKIP